MTTGQLKRLLSMMKLVAPAYVCICWCFEALLLLIFLQKIIRVYPRVMSFYTECKQLKMMSDIGLWFPCWRQSCRELWVGDDYITKKRARALFVAQQT